LLLLLLLMDALVSAPGANGYGPCGAPGGAAAAAPQATASIKLKDCPTPELLQHLPRMQRLMGRLLMCVPEGAAAVHPIILVRCAVVEACFQLFPAVVLQWERRGIQWCGLAC
jgi:hypothetical protein